MIVKYGKAIISSVGEMKELFGDFPRFRKFASSDSRFRQIYIDPARFLYVRNHSVSADEFFGPNDNGDGFPDEELLKAYPTFIGKRVSIDHQPHLVIGTILDSAYIYPTDPSNPLSGHYVQNILAIDKKKADEIDPNLISGLIDGKITDTSMGAIVGYSVCSVCNNIAKTESEYCVHIARYKMQKVRTASGQEVLAYERCYDVNFFEDSIIRPFSMGGLAGGRGADQKAKVLELVTADMKSKLGAPKPQKEMMREPNLKEPWDSVKPETSTEPSPPSVVDTQKVEPEEKSDVYDIGEAVEKIKEEREHDMPKTEPETIVEDRPNLFSAIPDEDLQSMIEEILEKTSSAETPGQTIAPERKEELEKQFEQVVELVKQGIPVEKAIEKVYNLYNLSGEEREYVIEEVEQEVFD